MLFVYFVVKDLYKINRPSRLRRAIGFDLSYLSTSKASPNDTGIVIIVIIIAIGKLDAVVHRGADYSTELFYFEILTPLWNGGHDRDQNILQGGQLSIGCLNRYTVRMIRARIIRDVVAGCGHEGKFPSRRIDGEQGCILAA